MARPLPQQLIAEKLCRQQMHAARVEQTRAQQALHGPSGRGPAVQAQFQPQVENRAIYAG